MDGLQSQSRVHTPEWYADLACPVPCGTRSCTGNNYQALAWRNKFSARFFFAHSRKKCHQRDPTLLHCPRISRAAISYRLGKVYA